MGLIGLSVLILVINNGVITDQITEDMSVRAIILSFVTVSMIFAYLRIFAAHKIGQINSRYQSDNNYRDVNMNSKYEESPNILRRPGKQTKS